MIHPTKGVQAALPIDRLRLGGSTGRIGEFGWVRSDIHGQPKRHEGADFLGNIGDPIYSAHPGKVVRVGWQNPRNVHEGYGKRIYLEDAATGLTTVYAHLDTPLVFLASEIPEGVVIGRLGISGNSDPDVPHLHFEVHEHGEKINPLWALFGDAGGLRDGFSLDWWKAHRK